MSIAAAGKSLSFKRSTAKLIVKTYRDSKKVEAEKSEIEENNHETVENLMRFQPSMAN